MSSPEANTVSPRPHGLLGHASEERMGIWEATTAAGLHFVSGQVPRNQRGEIIDGDLRDKIAQAMDNVDSSLRQVGSSMNDLVYVQIHLDIRTEKAWETAVSAIRDCVTPSKPAGSVIAVDGLMSDLYMVEISGVAASHDGVSVVREGSGEAGGYQRQSRSGEKNRMDIGVSEVVRVGDQVFVSGRTAADENGNIIGGNDVADQCHHALMNLQESLSKVGATMDDVVSNQIFLTVVPSQADLARICDVHKSAFSGTNRPTSTMVCVAGLLSRGAMVEIAAVAVVSENHDRFQSTIL